MRCRLKKLCFFMHESLESDIKNKNDERKNDKIMRKN